jgi:transposase InsO family protein
LILNTVAARMQGNAGAVAEKYAWIKQHKGEFPVASMCRFMRVSRNTYYAWLHRTPTPVEKDNAELTVIIHTLFAKSRATSGARRLNIALGRQDRSVTRRRIGRLMLTCKTKRKFKATTNSKHSQPIAPNHLHRQFTVKPPNQAYIPTQEGGL